MGKIPVMFAVLLGMVNGLSALSCQQCGTFTCPPVPRCAGDVTKDACRCCDVCAKIDGQSCGGPWDTSGTCSSGLTCVVDPNDPLGDQATGLCACPAHSSWDRCGSACPTTCDSLGTNIICPAVCVPGCACDDGYVLNNGSCIPEEQCVRTECPPHSTWDDCGSACPTTCDSLGTNVICPEICVSGCACDGGYVLNNGRCIPEEQCGRTECPPHSTWDDCGLACPTTCDNLGTDILCPRICIAGCACDDGYVLNNGSCIPEEQCPSDGCNYEGNHYNDGDEWAVRESPGLVCQCDGTEVVCYVVDCAPGAGYNHVIGRNGLWTCQRQTQCPAGYRYVVRSRRCYRLVDTGASYQDAERQCFQDGARLATVKAKQAYKHLKSAARQARSDVWIGLSDRVTEGTLTWSDGDPYRKSKRNNFWAKRALRQNNAEKDCVYMSASRRDKYRWRLGNCDDERLFVCEFVLD
ncbi:zonadhesin-like [Branchiostoma floridae x Branchiostoma belcheri]